MNCVLWSMADASLHGMGTSFGALPVFWVSPMSLD
jgi:hypothetical protein